MVLERAVHTYAENAAPLSVPMRAEGHLVPHIARTAIMRDSLDQEAEPRALGIGQQLYSCGKTLLTAGSKLVLLVTDFFEAEETI